MARSSARQNKARVARCKAHSPYRLYQFFCKHDADVLTYLKYFTFLSHEEIRALEESLQREPEKERHNRHSRASNAHHPWR
jgi:tyrosyl-tRNA synthetase